MYALNFVFASPTVTLISPTAGYADNSRLVNFTFEVSSVYDIINCTLEINDTTVSQNQSTIVQNVTQGMIYTFPSDGIYKWNIFCTSDSGGVSIGQGNPYIYIIIDTTEPSAILSTPLNNSYNSSEQSFSVYLSDDLGLMNTTLFIFNSTNDLVSQIFDGDENIFGMTNITITIPVSLIEGRYHWSYQVFDLAGNFKVSQINTVSIDTTLPMIDLTYPGGFYNNNTKFDGTIKYTLFESDPEYCWYVLNGLRTDFSCNQNLSDVSALEGTNHLTLFIQDLAGNIRNKSVSFTLDYLVPTIASSYPDNNSHLNYSNVDFDYILEKPTLKINLSDYSFYKNIPDSSYLTFDNGFYYTLCNNSRNICGYNISNDFKLEKYSRGTIGASHMTAYGDRIFTGDNTAGAVYITNATTMLYIGQVHIPNVFSKYVDDICVDDNYIFLSTTEGYYEFFSSKTYEGYGYRNLERVSGSVGSNTEYGGCWLSPEKDYVYWIGGSSGGAGAPFDLYIFNYSDLSLYSSMDIGRGGSSGNQARIRTDENNLYLDNISSGSQLLMIYNLTKLKSSGFDFSSSYITSIASNSLARFDLKDGSIYLTDADGLRVYDATNYSLMMFINGTNASGEKIWDASYEAEVFENYIFTIGFNGNNIIKQKQYNLPSITNLTNSTIYIYNSTDLYNKTTTILSGRTQIVGIPVSLIDGIYSWFTEVFDFAGNFQVSQNKTVLVDTVLPEFIDIEDQTIYNIDPLNYHIIARDINNISCFTVNDTDFSIDCNGVLNNHTKLDVRTYLIKIGVNDTSGNFLYRDMSVNVVLTPDITPPYFTSDPSDDSIDYLQPFSVQFNAEDDRSFGYYSADDSRFSIDQTGLMANTTSLGVGDYLINITINDTAGNEHSIIYGLAVNKIMPEISLSFDKTTPQTVGTMITPTCSLIAGVGSLSLSNGTTEVPEDLGVGSWDFNCSYEGNENYSAYSISSAFDIIKYAPTLTFLANGGVSDLFLTYGEKVNISALASAGTLGLDKDNEDYLSDDGIDKILSVGSYIFRANITGDENNSEVGYSYYNVNITKANSIVKIFLNNSEENITIITGTSIWINATREAGEGMIQLYNNDLLMNSGESRLSNLTLFDTLGSYNLTAIYSDTQNYSSSFETWYVNVIDKISPEVTLNSPTPEYSDNTKQDQNITFSCSATDNYALESLSLYITDSSNQGFSLNQTDHITGLSNSSNWTLFLGNGDYTWNCLSYDSSGNNDFSSENRSIMINFSDTDQDGIGDELDFLQGNLSSVNATGLSRRPSHTIQCSVSTVCL